MADETGEEGRERSQVPRPESSTGPSPSPLEFLKAAAIDPWANPYRRERASGGATATNGSPPARSQPCILAYVSLLVVCLACIFGYLLLIPGIVSGHFAVNQCRRDRKLTGVSFAEAALVAGYLVAVVLFFTVCIPLWLAWVRTEHAAAPNTPAVRDRWPG